MTRTPGHALRAVTGEEAEFAMSTQWTVLAEHLRPLDDHDELQSGLRYVFGSDSVDTAAGLSRADH